MRKTWVGVLFAGTLLELIWIGTYRITPLRQHSGAFIGLMLLASLTCFVSFLKLPITNQKRAWLVVALGLVFRLTVLPASPDQSEDVYRYIWDAKVASHGISPFAYPPNAPELQSIRDATIYPMVNSKPYITAYPPLSQALFRIDYSIFGDRLMPMKAVFAFLEFCALLVAWRILNASGRSLQPLLLVAWNPFFIFEFSHSGHSDSAMVLFILLSIYLLGKARNSWAILSYAAAVFSKLHPALWLPLFLRRVPLKSTLAGLIAAIGLTLVYFSPSSLLKYAFGLRLYYRLFEFNAGIHYALRAIGRTFYNQGWDKVTGPYLAAILVLIAILITWKFPLRNSLDILHAGFWIMTADLCLATTVHPWYISWAALALPFFPYAFMFYWTAACFLSYVAYSYRPVFEPSWALLLEYVPMYCLMAWEISRRRPLLESPSGEFREKEKVLSGSAAEGRGR